MLAFKSAVISGLLLMWGIGYYWLWLFLALALVFYFYLRPFFNTRQFLTSFFVFLAIAIISLEDFASLRQIRFVEENLWVLVSIFVLFWLIFFLILGIKNLAFINRHLLYYFLSGILFFLTFSLFFKSDKSILFLSKYLILGLAIYFLSREFLNFIFGEGEFIKSSDFPILVKKNLVSITFCLLIMEFVWALSLLPIGFINTAGLALILVVILADFFLHYFKGGLNRFVILRNITLFMILFLAIFMGSKWSP